MVHLENQKLKNVKVEVEEDMKGNKVYIHMIAMGLKSKDVRNK